MVREFRTLYWKGSRLYLIDQKALPHKLRYVALSDYRQVAKAIKDMTVRGAPAIGVAAAYGLALAALSAKGKDPQKVLERLQKAADVLRSTRPTAVNLFWAIERVMARAEAAARNGEDIAGAVLEEAHAIAEEDVKVNRAIGMHGAQLIKDGARVMTYCNAGALATVGYGTALGVIRAAVEQGKRVFVYVPETRPKLQGARLTSFELKLEGIEHRVIPDNTAAFLMSKGEVDLHAEQHGEELGGPQDLRPALPLDLDEPQLLELPHVDVRPRAPDRSYGRHLDRLVVGDERERPECSW
jgi:methylthioribose-1-phosphate isomerase